MKIFKYIAHGIVWTIVGSYLLFVVLLHLPSVQSYIGKKVADAIEEKLGTKVSIGRVDVGLFNRLTIDSVRIEDQKYKPMLDVERLAATIDIGALLKEGRVVISGAQLFGMNANLYKANSNAKPNFQFALDSLASDDTAQTPLDVRIQSLVIRRGAVRYDQLDAPKQPTLTLQHLAITDLNGNISLKQLTNDSISLKIRELSMKEQSGLDLRSLTGSINAGRRAAQISGLRVQLPKSNILISKAEAQYKETKKGRELTHFDLVLDPSELAPSDLAFLDKHLNNSKETLSLHANVTGNSNTINVQDIRIKDTEGRLSIIGNGQIAELGASPKWKVNADDLKLSADGTHYVMQTLDRQHIKLPQEITRLGNIHFKGSAQGYDDFLSGKGTLLSDAGNVIFDAATNGSKFRGIVKADDINLARILQDGTFGMLSADITTEGSIAQNETPLPFSNLFAKGTIQRLDYNNYSYRNIAVDGVYNNKSFNGKMSMDDPNGKIDVDGKINLAGNKTEADLIAHLRNFKPQALHLTNSLSDYTYSLDLDTHISGNSLTNAVGFINVKKFNMRNSEDNVSLDNLHIKTGYEDGEHVVDIDSDFGNVLMKGQYDFSTISESMVNLIASKIPTMPNLPRNRRKTHNDLAFMANIYDMNWFHQILDIPLEIQQPIHIKGNLDDNAQKADIEIQAPSFSYNGIQFGNFSSTTETEGDTLIAIGSVQKTQDDGDPIELHIDAKAYNNKILSHIFCDTHSEKPLKGNIYTETDFMVGDDGHRTAHIRIHPSEILIDKSIWQLQPSDILYADNKLFVDYFQINNNNQHINISGKVTENPSDSLVVELNNIDVEYVLDLVNFHSVEFAGYASGTAVVQNLFKTPKAKAQLTVTDFKFEKGRMGTLYASANYDNNSEQINISARTDDEMFVTDSGTGIHLTGDAFINGFVSPKRKELDLRILSDGARAEFLEDFCRSFMDEVEVRAQGTCRVFGGFKSVNLEGNLVADGTLKMTTLNTTYTLRNDTVTLVPDHIIFHNDTVYDREGNKAVVKGGLHHTNLKNMTYDIDIEAKNFLAYDFHDYGNYSFYGTVFGTGTCNINGKKGEVNINVNAVPEQGSFIEYNAAHPDNINKAEFIQWRGSDHSYVEKEEIKPHAPTTDVHINMYADVNQNFTLRILMDENTGDKISLVGDGDLRATYFNKGTFDIYGTYLIDHGTYVMTVQNVIKKLFTFQSGSTMIFSGDPYSTALNLKGQYIVPAVSLSDLQMGRSFTQNNIRAICLMNIGGTAGAPSVTFGLDLPTLSTDAKQMVMSVINSQEDMNQQVLYLLAVGRFMPQRNNNASEDNAQQSQTSLAMQSLLSGTISQQLNSMLTSMVKIPNWNFGAHISTGNDGFSNAEYEGLLSGRLLNNRLLINGEFGYRDNVQTDQSSFIGDFDVQYLLRPDGNLAVKVYNQTNDRYFTRNSLNTQGIGLIIKKDFNNLGELFGKKKKKDRNKKQKQAQQAEAVQTKQPETEEQGQGNQDKQPENTTQEVK